MPYEGNIQNTLRESAGDLQNEAQTCEPRDTALTQPRSRSVPMINDFDPPKIRKHLTALRKQYGADSPVGNRCSNLIGQLEFLPKTTGDHRKGLEKNIADQVADLARLTARR